MSFLAVCLFALVSVGYAQRFVPGPCPTVKNMDGFDKTRFYGRWFEVEKTPSMFDLFLRCMSADYSDDNDGSMNVVIRGVSLAGLPISLAGDALPVDSSKKGFYSVRYGFGVPFQGTLVTIVDTDYEKYAVLYSCTNSVMSNLYHTEYIWLLGRNESLPNYIRQNSYDTLDTRKITRTGLNLSDRNNCPPPNSLAATAGREDNMPIIPGYIVPLLPRVPAIPAVQPLIPYASTETSTASSIVSYVASGAEISKPVVDVVSSDIVEPVEIVKPAIVPEIKKPIIYAEAIKPVVVSEIVEPVIAHEPIVPVVAVDPIVPVESVAINLDHQIIV